MVRGKNAALTGSLGVPPPCAHAPGFALGAGGGAVPSSSLFRRHPEPKRIATVNRMIAARIFTSERARVIPKSIVRPHHFAQTEDFRNPRRRAVHRPVG